MLYAGKVVVIGQKWLLSCKNGSIRVQIVVFGQGGCFKKRINVDVVVVCLLFV